MEDKDLQFTDWQKTIKETLGTEQWVTVYNVDYEDAVAGFSETRFCALIPNELVPKALEKTDWDFMIGHGMPGHIRYGATGETKYFRFGDDDGIEPLVICREYYGIREDTVEILDEFRHWFNLYEERDGRMVRFDDDGDEEEVVRISHKNIQIKLKYLKEFLALKNMQLALFFEMRRHSKQSLSELGLEEKSETVQGENYRYVYSTNTWDLGEEWKSYGRLIGKKMIEGAKDFKHEFPWERRDKQCEDFIIGVDSEGKEIIHTCDRDELANMFGANEGAARDITPVFFKRDVLDKYYANPTKYEIEDGILRCKGLWSLRMDNNHDKYITVLLCDLGLLSSKEQKHWRNYNIPPDGHISEVAFRRGFLAQFTDPQRSDLRFKYVYRRIQKKWLKEVGWTLFKSLRSEDEHHFTTLRIPTKEDQSEFDQQITSVSKILIESINEKMITGEIPDDIVGSINRLEAYLKSKGIEQAECIIFLRNLQDLRDGMAHRKGEKFKRGSEYFGLSEKGFVKTIDAILATATHHLEQIESLIEKLQPVPQV